MHTMRLLVLSLMWVGCQAAAPAKPPAEGTPAGTGAPENPPAQQAPEEGGGKVELPDGSGATTVTLELMSQGAEAPRMLEAYLRYGSGLTFEANAGGNALTQSGKRLVVQERPGNLLRVVAFSADNLAPIQPGTLASLSFAGDGEVELLYERSTFAPGGARPTAHTLRLAAREAP